LSIPSTLKLGALLVLATGLSGCAYDYLQHTDRVAYSAGDAVRANIERETLDPSKASMQVTSGIGKDGYVTPNAGAVTASLSE